MNVKSGHCSQFSNLRNWKEEPENELFYIYFAMSSFTYYLLVPTCYCDRFMSSHSTVTRYTAILLYGGVMVRDKKSSGVSRTLRQFQKGMVPLVACNKQETMLRTSLSFSYRAQKLALRIAETVGKKGRNKKPCVARKGYGNYPEIQSAVLL